MELGRDSGSMKQAEQQWGDLQGSQCPSKKRERMTSSRQGSQKHLSCSQS